MSSKQMTREELLEKLKGVKELAVRGVDGEKKNAQAILEKLMVKYNISEKEFETEEVDMHWFRFKTELERRLVSQVIYMILGNVAEYKKSRHKLVGVYCTNAKNIEIEITYDFYKNALNEELKRFYSAFINVNHIFHESSKASSKAIDPVESFKLQQMMDGMDRHVMNNMIEEESDEES